MRSIRVKVGRWLINLLDTVKQHGPQPGPATAQEQRFTFSEMDEYPSPSTEHWLELLNTGRCPDCASSTFYRGPRGGHSVNVKCAGNCGHKFCFCPPFTPQRIDNDDSLYNIGYPQRLEEL